MRGRDKSGGRFVAIECFGQRIGRESRQQRVGAADGERQIDRKQAIEMG